jgi:hypothetical protein
MFSNFNHRRLKDLLIGTIIGMVLIGFIQEVKAAAVATMPNEGGGQVVLTDEPCKHEGKVYSQLNRVYTYTARGYTVEGCYAVEDDTVVAIWHTTNAEKMRYPISAFTLIKKKSVRYGT